MAKKELRIKELCKARGITQIELACRLGYNSKNGAISFSQAIKRNKFDVDRLGEIVDALNLGIDDKDHYSIPDLFEAKTITCPKCGTKFELKEVE